LRQVLVEMVWVASRQPDACSPVGGTPQWPLPHDGDLLHAIACSASSRCWAPSACTRSPTHLPGGSPYWMWRRRLTRLPARSQHSAQAIGVQSWCWGAMGPLCRRVWRAPVGITSDANAKAQYRLAVHYRLSHAYAAPWSLTTPSLLHENKKSPMRIGSTCSHGAYVLHASQLPANYLQRWRKYVISILVKWAYAKCSTLRASSGWLGADLLEVFSSPCANFGAMPSSCIAWIMTQILWHNTLPARAARPTGARTRPRGRRRS